VTLVLRPPQATKTKRHNKLYANTTEAFLEAQPLLSHLLKEFEWKDKEGISWTKCWEALKTEIKHRLQDLRRIRQATRKNKKATFLNKLWKDAQHTQGAVKLQAEIKANLASTQNRIARKKGESIDAGIKCDTKFFRKIATKWTNPTIDAIDPPPGASSGSLHTNMTEWWKPTFTASYKQSRRGKHFQEKTQKDWLTGIVDRLPAQVGAQLLEPVTLQEVKFVIKKNGYSQICRVIYKTCQRLKNNSQSEQHNRSVCTNGIARFQIFF
jgi:hypothetical protein